MKKNLEREQKLTCEIIMVAPLENVMSSKGMFGHNCKFLSVYYRPKRS